MKTVALIPARGGSKSVIDKNLRQIAGKSLIEITINHAKSTKLIHEIYVSSDSERILRAATSFNCLPIKRSALASTDTASANDVVTEFINHPDVKLAMADQIVYLQPTSPFRAEGIIEEGIRLYEQKGKPIVGVTKVAQHPSKMLRINSSGIIEKYHRESDPTENRQTLPEIFIATGSLYIFSVSDFLKSNKIPVGGAIPYIVSGIDTFDIDSELDMKLAQEIGRGHEF